MTGQRIGDVAAVVDLAERTVIGCPQPDNTAPAGMPQRVRADLARRDDEIGAPSGAQSGLGCESGHQRPDWPQVTLVPEFLRAGWRQQRLAKAGRQAALAEVIAVYAQLLAAGPG